VALYVSLLASESGALSNAQRIASSDQLQAVEQVVELNDPFSDFCSMSPFVHYGSRRAQVAPPFNPFGQNARKIFKEKLDFQFILSQKSRAKLRTTLSNCLNDLIMNAVLVCSF
jgi:hypothetical protein